MPRITENNLLESTRFTGTERAIYVTMWIVDSRHIRKTSYIYDTFQTVQMNVCHYHCIILNGIVTILSFQYL